MFEFYNIKHNIRKMNMMPRTFHFRSFHNIFFVMLCWISFRFHDSFWSFCVESGVQKRVVFVAFRTVFVTWTRFITFLWFPIVHFFAIRCWIWRTKTCRFRRVFVMMTFFVTLLRFSILHVFTLCAQNSYITVRYIYYI